MDDRILRARLVQAAETLGERLRREAMAGRGFSPAAHTGTLTVSVEKNERGVAISLTETGEGVVARELAGERQNAALEPVITGAGEAVIAALRGVFR